MTILQLDDAERTLRLACNRDEMSSRPAALRPRIRRSGVRRVLMPLDPISDGTWIGVNDCGIVATLLNAYPAPSVEARDDSGRHASRGGIIPTVLACVTLEAAMEIACGINPRDCEPYRLVLVDRTRVAEVCSNGEHLTINEPVARCGPVMHTSSGLGDSVVDAPRRRLFDDMIRDASGLQAVQDAFHRHSWPDRHHLSVCMERDEARTVSYCVVEVGTDRAVMWYLPQPPDQPGLLSRHTLSLRT